MGQEDRHERLAEPSPREVEPRLTQRPLQGTFLIPPILSMVLILGVPMSIGRGAASTMEEIDSRRGSTSDEEPGASGIGRILNETIIPVVELARELDRDAATLRVGAPREPCKPPAKAGRDEHAWNTSGRVDLSLPRVRHSLAMRSP